jgi:hypothetical protein
VLRDGPCEGSCRARPVQQQRQLSAAGLTPVNLLTSRCSRRGPRPEARQQNEDGAGARPPRLSARSLGRLMKWPYRGLEVFHAMLGSVKELHGVGSPCPCASSTGASACVM